MKRSGLITTKIGMTRLYDDGGVAHPVTVLSVGDCAVIGNRTQEKMGMSQTFWVCVKQKQNMLQNHS
jgi:ribosomal protein L3